MKKFFTLISAVLFAGSMMAASAVFSISSAEINTGKVGTIALGTSNYGSQAVANPATWYTCAKDGFTFKGARVCIANVPNGSGLQMQGNASNVANQGFFGNETAFEGLSELKIVARVQTTSTYDPAFHVYADSLGTTKIVAPVDTVKTTVDGFYKFVYTYEFAEGSRFFNIKNDLAGALYIDSIYVTYEAGLPEGPAIEVNVDEEIFSITPANEEDIYMFLLLTSEVEGGISEATALALAEAQISWINADFTLEDFLDEGMAYQGALEDIPFELLADGGLAAGDYAMAAFVVAENDPVLHTAEMTSKMTYVEFTIQATPTAIENIENVKAVKVLRNGQVLIIREGALYNTVGAKL